MWSLVLCLHASQEEVVIGSPYHGREMAGTEALVGYFVNMLALRIEMVARGCSCMHDRIVVVFVERLLGCT